MARLDVIECCDALRGLFEVPDGFCSLLLTDPPYSSGGMFRGDRSMLTSEKYQTSGADKKPEFYGDTRDERSLLLWDTLWLAECWRILGDGSSALVFSDWRQLANTGDAVQAAGFTLRGIVPWRKTAARPQPNSFRQECEFVIWATKGAVDRRPLTSAKYLPGFYEYAAPVGDERIHSTQKPVGLIRDLMEVAPEGCVVLDPFMGSGTTAVAAVQTGRHFVGFELSREYCDAANRRVRAVMRGGRRPRCLATLFRRCLCR